MKVGRKHYKTVWLKGYTVYLINQKRLPYKFVIVSSKDYKKTARYIKDMTVRGAGALGVAAGFAMAQAVRSVKLGASPKDFKKEVLKCKKFIDSTRPTARNLSYATERVAQVAINAAYNVPLAQINARNEALEIAREDTEQAKRIAQVGEKLIPRKATILTHCNAGWLAFSDWGTALAPIYLAKRRGKRIFVYADETRPRSQGAYLTAWELGHENIPHAVIVDNSAGCLMRQGKIDLVIVGADRIARNGDVANKIGTYQVAVLAKENKVPFYVAAPLSTFDTKTRNGAGIPIERRSQYELFDRKWFRTLNKSRVENLAFDITPAKYIRALITPKGLIKPNAPAIKRLFR